MLQLSLDWATKKLLPTSGALQCDSYHLEYLTGNVVPSWNRCVVMHGPRVVVVDDTAEQEFIEQRRQNVGHSLSACLDAVDKPVRCVARLSCCAVLQVRFRLEPEPTTLYTDTHCHHLSAITWSTHRQCWGSSSSIQCATQNFLPFLFHFDLSTNSIVPAKSHLSVLHLEICRMTLDFCTLQLTPLRDLNTVFTKRSPVILWIVRTSLSLLNRATICIIYWER